MKVLVFSVIYNSLVIPAPSTICVYVLIIDRNASSLYEVGSAVKKYLTPNLVHYIIQHFARRFVPFPLLNLIDSLFSLNFGTSEIISRVKEELISYYNTNNTKSMQRVGYIYEREI